MLENKTREDINTIISIITSRLRSIGVYKVILFGSYAWGTPEDGSDLDILVVTDENYFPSNYDQRMDLHLKVSSKLVDIKKQIPVDLVVYTKPMYKKFLELDSMFSREVKNKGKILYEKSH